MKTLQWPSIDVFAPDEPPQGPLDACDVCGLNLPPGEPGFLRQGRIFCRICHETIPRWNAGNPRTWANHGRRRRRTGK